MKFFTLLFIAAFAGCAATIPIHTDEDMQQLETAKALFKNQLENDLHPIIQAYLDEVLHDPTSFRLQRVEYTVANYVSTVPYEKRSHLFSKRSNIFYKQVLIPTYLVNMRFYSKGSDSGLQLVEMKFYLLKDQTLILPSGVAVSLPSAVRASGQERRDQ